VALLRLLLDGDDVTSQAIINENATYATIHFVYNQSSHNVQLVGSNIIPEYPHLEILTLFLGILTSVILVYAKQNRMKNCNKKQKTTDG